MERIDAIVHLAAVSNDPMGNVSSVSRMISPMRLPDSLGGIDVSMNPAPPERRSYRVDFGMFKRPALQHCRRESLDTAIQGLKAGLATIGFNDPNFGEYQFIRLMSLTQNRSTRALTEDLRWRSEAVLANEKVA